jgi:hypothetical protein
MTPFAKHGISNSLIGTPGWEWISTFHATKACPEGIKIHIKAPLLNLERNSGLELKFQITPEMQYNREW